MRSHDSASSSRTISLSPLTAIVFALICAAVFLTALSPLQAQAPAAVIPPYLVVVQPAGEPSGTAEMGSQVTFYGSGFCGSCSSVTLTIGNEIVAPITIATVPVNSNGTFNYTYTVAVPFAFRYVITAQQTSSSGKKITDSVGLIVAQGDEAQEIIIPGANADHQAEEGSSGRVSKTAPSERAAVGMPIVPSGVTEAPANIIYAGRSVSIDVSKQNNAVAIAASESGGLWKTTDTGATWAPLTGLPTFRMSAVRMAPSNDQIVIATAWVDSHVVNGGGLWRSTDGGTTWSKPSTADPTPGYPCPTLINAWGIAFAPTTNDVFVGTDCGVSVSHDLGATWTHVTLPPVYGLVAQPGSSNTVIDTCGNDGHHRSTDGGATWSSTSSALPRCPYTGVQTIAVSPLEPNVLFASISNKDLYESDDGGTTWTDLSPNQGASRTPWVATHLSADNNPNHFDIYFGSGLKIVRQTCTNTGGPGTRCSTTWSGILTVDHNDQNGLAFSTSSNCAQFVVSDGGVHNTPDCGATWHMTGAGTGGYHALQMYEMAGQVHPGSTDLYFGTQDNNLWASNDNGSTWGNPICCEGFYLQVPHDSPSDSGQLDTGNACSPCFNFATPAPFNYTPPNPPGWNNPPGGQGNPFLISPGVYLQWSSTSPPTNQLYLTTDSGSTWNPVTGASTSLQFADRMVISGPAASPTVYQTVKRSGGLQGLIKITGVLTPSATISNADTGIGNIPYWCSGQGSFRCPQVFGVDPNNPNHLIVADTSVNEMMVSTNGGLNWAPDARLTQLVTGFGQFQFSQPTGLPGIGVEAHTIAFDPSNGNTILVGTEQAGIIASFDGGNTWGQLGGSNAVPAVSSFFFDEVQKDAFASTYGRGLWKLDLSQVLTTDLAITKTAPTPTVTAGTNFTYTIAITNNGPDDASNVTVTDTLPAGVSLVSTSIPCTNTTGTLTCTIGGLPNGAGAAITVTVFVPSAGVGAPTITNTATVSSENLDSNAANNTASVTTTVVFVADLAITKTESPSPAPAGTNITYTIGVSNAGPSDAANTVVTETLPAGVNFVSASPSVCTGTTVLTCNLGTVVDGGSATLAITVFIPANFLSSMNVLTTNITNTATVASSATDPNLTNNTASVTTKVISVAYFTMTATAVPNPVHEGSKLVYNVSFFNHGPSDAQLAYINQTIPAAFKLLGANYEACGEGVAETTCRLGNVVPFGFHLTFQMTYQIPKTFLGTKTSQVVTSQFGIHSSSIDPNPPTFVFVKTTVIP